MELIVSILVGVIVAATPLVFAAIGELVTEKAGVLNLGVEGMMVVGAIAAFSCMVLTGSPLLSVIAAAVAGGVMGALFGLLTLTFLANQVAAGLALTMFGLGLSALWGQAFTGISVQPLPALQFPVLSDLPIVGRLLFRHDLLTYASIALVAAVAWFLSSTRGGLIVRSIGENHDAAHAIGYSVIGWRYLAVVFGGACAGLGGAYLSLVQTPFWVEKMTAGRGWIALALVVFAAWQPWRALAGAYVFGGITILQLHSQALGLKIDPQLLSMLPYLATIAVLVAISGKSLQAGLAAPACLGKIFYSAS